jgi:hypothetical protein
MKKKLLYGFQICFYTVANKTVNPARKKSATFIHHLALGSRKFSDQLSTLVVLAFPKAFPIPRVYGEKGIGQFIRSLLIRLFIPSACDGATE